ncbi:acetyltransferase [Gordonia shandongensis]|uniref:acetyltransferase n=1 Tax=Gordonia shandongensis TaxID=376351 RepID=UPI000A02A32D|nr:acetyltransferase [Gordonia shandongensis]
MTPRAARTPRDRIVLRSAVRPDDYPDLVRVWRSAVRATHHFLAAADFLAIDGALERDYLPSVDLTVAEVDRRIVGFSGLADGRLEMLFVEADSRGRGIGSALLDRAASAHPRLELDVNEQNPQAVEFYAARGFEQVGRSDVDGDGRPYPLLTLRLTRPGRTD